MIPRDSSLVILVLASEDVRCGATENRDDVDDDDVRLLDDGRIIMDLLWVNNDDDA